MSRYANHDAPKWVAANLEDRGELAPLGKALAYIVGASFGGVYNAISRKQIEKGEWHSPHVAECVIPDREMATHDFNELAILVYLSGRLGVRTSIRAVAPGYVRIRVIPSSACSGTPKTMTQANLAFDTAFGDWPEKIVAP